MMFPLSVRFFKTLVYTALCCACLVACSPQGTDVAAASVATAKFQTLKGSTFTAADLQGKVTLVNFWATSCTTCVREMPMMVKQFTDFQARGYRHIAVAMDYDSPAFVQAFATERALPFDVVHDASGELAKVFGQVKLTPTSFLLDKKGAIVKRYVGAPNEAELKAAIETLLASS